MSKLDPARSGRGGLADITHGEPLAIHLPIGAAAYAVSGRLWITQEGLYEDAILAPGDRVDIERKGLVVVAAVDQAAVVYFATPSAAGASRYLPAAFYDAAIARAAELRRRELVRLAALTRAGLLR